MINEPCTKFWHIKKKIYFDISVREKKRKFKEAFNIKLSNQSKKKQEDKEKEEIKAIEESNIGNSEKTCLCF